MGAKPVGVLGRPVPLFWLLSGWMMGGVACSDPLLEPTPSPSPAAQTGTPRPGETSTPGLETPPPDSLTPGPTDGITPDITPTFPIATETPFGETPGTPTPFGDTPFPETPLPETSLPSTPTATPVMGTEPPGPTPTVPPSGPTPTVPPTGPTPTVVPPTATPLPPGPTPTVPPVPTATHVPETPTLPPPTPTVPPLHDQDQDGFPLEQGDCDDTDPSTYPGAEEVCDEKDNNCNGEIDEDVALPFYLDFDEDSYGDPEALELACIAPEGFVEDDTDCDDDSPTVHPEAMETCNGVDDDCDDVVDEGAMSLWYRDWDADTYGDASVTALACAAPTGYVGRAQDCNDRDPAINPAATEICDPLATDEDCNGLEGMDDPGLLLTTTGTFYQDADRDGYGNPASALLECPTPEGYVANDDDCDDSDPTVYPGSTETANGNDDDCDGQVDEGVYFASCWARKQAIPNSPDGTYTIDPDGGGALPLLDVYCDMNSDGGGWTLLEVGVAAGTNIRPRTAVGLVVDPTQSTSARLSRQVEAAILAAGQRHLKFGNGYYGYLYTGALQSNWLTNGVGAYSFGTVITPNLISERWGGPTYPGSRFAWPLDGSPAACLNSDGSDVECGNGLHIGTWNCCGWTDKLDNLYVNNGRCCSKSPDNGFEVWGR